MQTAAGVKQQLISLIDQVQQHFHSLTGPLLTELTTIYSGMLGTQLETISHIRQRVKQIIGGLKQAGGKGKEMESSMFAELTFIDYQLVFDLISMERKFFVVDQELLK